MRLDFILWAIATCQAVSRDYYSEGTRTRVTNTHMIIIVILNAIILITEGNTRKVVFNRM